MSETGSISDHINEFNTIVSQLNYVDINFEDEIKPLFFMSSLPESWDTFVAAISSSRGSEKLKFDEIRDVIHSESIRKREMGDSPGSALRLIEGGEVRRKAKINMVDQNQRIEENP